ncbi:MAG: PEP-CTERM sorting domain-containing protein [Planctomycetota bacterium]
MYFDKRLVGLLVFTVMAVTLLSDSHVLAQPAPPPGNPNPNFVDPSFTNPLFGFERFSPGTTYAEFYNFAGDLDPTDPLGNIGVNENVRRLPDITPDSLFGFAPGTGFTFDFTTGASATADDSSLTGSGVLVTSEGFQVTIPGVDTVDPGRVVLQVAYRTPVDSSIIAPFFVPVLDENGIPTGASVLDEAAFLNANLDPSSDSVTARFDESEVLLSLADATSASSSLFSTVAEVYDVTGPGRNRQATLLVEELLVFDVPDSSELYTIDFGPDGGLNEDFDYVSVSLDTFAGQITAVPEPTSLACLGLVSGAYMLRRRRSKFDLQV